MPILRRFTTGLLALLSLSFFAGHAGADAPAWKKDAVEMFEAGWRAGTEAQVEAETHYRAAQQAAGSDQRIEYAWALVLIKQRKFDAALEQLDRILKKDPDNLSAMTWKVRLRIHSKKYPAAVVEMEQLASAAAASLAKAKDASQKADGLAAARFLGRVFGFLEAPAELKATQRDELKAALDQQLTGDAQPAFEAGRATVLEQFNTFQRQGQQHRVEDQQKEEDGKKQQQQQIDALQVNLEQETSAIAAERTKLRDEQRKELADVSRDARQADTAVTQAESRLAAVARQWSLLLSERDRWLVAMDAERDPARREMFRNEAARIDISLGTVDGERRIREGDVLRTRAHRADVERSRLEVQRRSQAAVAALDKREDAVRRGLKRLGGEQKKIDRPVSNTSSRERNLNAKATAFVTYDEFPLDIERARLLSSLK